MATLFDSACSVNPARTRRFGLGLAHPGRVDRPPVGPTSAGSAPCCSADDPTPCSVCAAPPTADDASPGFADDLADAGAASDPRHDGLTLTLGELVEQQVRAYRAWNNDTGDLIAEHLWDLAELVLATGATTPDQLRSRRDVLLYRDDAALIDLGERSGFASGLAWAGRPEHD